MYRELSKLNGQTTNDPIGKRAKDVDRHFSQEDIQMATKHVKKRLPSLAIEKMNIKTVARYQ